MRQLPPLNALRCFEAAARKGSFNQAAEELYVTPSAVSHQIKTLEEFLGLKLFRRERRKAMLTAAGEKYLSSIQHALDEIDSATRRLITAPNISVVNLAVAAAFLTRWLVPRLGQFQAQHPDVELRLSASVGQIDFQQSDTDMAIYLGHGEWDDVETHFLRSTTIVPVCSPRLLEGDKPLETLQDLKRHTLIHVASRASEWPQIMAQTGITDIGSAKSLTFSNTSLALGAAMEGLGIALSDIGLVERELQYGQLVIPFDLQLNTRKAFYLVYQKNRPLTYSMEAFRDWILAEMETQQAQLAEQLEEKRAEGN
ncbi:transcriptional regulator GcvA [Marinobacterium sp. CAU 1594]|nr:transcriptional regulator GcvA [Marinobacterium arenosum]